jgi:pimeloyl-ACP methyl ester carboxylesterase
MASTHEEASVKRSSTSAVGVGLVSGAIAVGLLVAPSPVSAAPALEWSSCEDPALASDGFECARLIVPMDRRHPSAGTFSLPLARHRATGAPEDRIGSLVFNPGGPGGPGVASIGFVWGEFVPDEIKQRFDLVTWDPRGVGGSIPALAGCDSPWPARPSTGPVDWADVVAKFTTVVSSVNADCQKKNSAFVDHIGTVENVRDLDRIRAALGEEQLTYWGMSYGTRIGYVYAKTFPGRARALVFDGSIDPGATTIGLAEGGAAPDQAYGVWADAYPAAAAQVAAVLSVLNRRTVTLPGGTRLTRWIVKDVIYNAIPQQSIYPDLATVASIFYGAVLGTPEQRAEAAPIAARLARSQRDSPNPNTGGVFAVVNCLDYPSRPTQGVMTQAVLDAVRIAPAYGGSLATMYAVGCPGLTLKPDPVPLITGDGPKVPVLILGASRDGSTIQSWTGRMSRAFPASRTVTYAGGQHVTWGLAHSDCVNAVANAYVTSLTLPPMDVGCPNTVTPGQ